MDSFIFDFNTDSTLTNDTNSTHSDLDWTAFQSAPPPTTNSPLSPIWLSQQDDAVAPSNRSSIVTTPHDDEIYFEIEHFFNGLNQQQQQQYHYYHQQQQAHSQPIQQQQGHSQPIQQQPVHSQPIQQQQHGIIEPVHVNINIPDKTMNDRDHIEPPSRAHLSLVINERPMSCLPTPLVSRSSSSRSQCYHKLPDHAVKLMQEWYNANLDDPYPRSPDKKRFITEGNITAQQCRSWFANRRQRLKHVKKNQSKSVSSRIHHSIQAKLSQIPPVEAQAITHEHCYYCQQQQLQQQLQQQQQQQQQLSQQQQQIALSPSSMPLTMPSTPTTTTTTTTLNVVINQQTVEQLIHNSLRKLLYPALM
ncbi:unnamed protein product [Adineta steineri]|uniref:Homeobox domain-containing protein n=1 Tax=Adineta steineri TaxID=433720 RepID=A0A818S2M3_9BILA|nr:unnamed protein product [Adineta steineri]CAF3587607.1 unnamed protein product [Adineta steineri]CAF3663350.1 unnamed protein product [Adineta steineri]